MMHIITVNGCAWIAAKAIVSVRRSGAQWATIRLDDGEVIASHEPYEAFVERLNATLLRAAGVDVACDAEEMATLPARAPDPERSAPRELRVPEIGLEPALP